MLASTYIDGKKQSEPLSVGHKQASGPIEHQTSHSERSLLDLLGCEEKEVNLEQSVGELEATTKCASVGLTKYANSG
jgi:hypothetical protein